MAESCLRPEPVTVPSSKANTAAEKSAHDCTGLNRSCRWVLSKVTATSLMVMAPMVAVAGPPSSTPKHHRVHGATLLPRRVWNRYALGVSSRASFWSKTRVKFGSTAATCACVLKLCLRTHRVEPPGLRQQQDCCHAVATVLACSLEAATCGNKSYTVCTIHHTCNSLR